MMEPTPELLEDAAKLWKAMGFVNDRHGSVSHLALCLAVRDEAHAANLSDAEARIAELEATIEQMKADHACELADMATRFRAVNVERLSEQLGADIFALRDRAEAAEALLKEAGTVLALTDIPAFMTEGLEGGRGVVTIRFDDVDGMRLFVGKLRAARAIHDKIGETLNG